MIIHSKWLENFLQFDCNEHFIGVTRVFILLNDSKVLPILFRPYFAIFLILLIYLFSRIASLQIIFNVT